MTVSIVAGDIPARLLSAPSLFAVRAILPGRAAANDNFDDDPPPCASAPVPAFAEAQDEEAFGLMASARRGIFLPEGPAPLSPAGIGWQNQTDGCSTVRRPALEKVRGRG